MRERSNDRRWEARILSSKGQSEHRMNQRSDTFCRPVYRSTIENEDNEFIFLEVHSKTFTCSGRITEMAGLYP